MKYFCVTDGYILVIFSFFVLNNSCIAFNWHGFGELSRLVFETKTEESELPIRASKLLQ